MPRFQNKTVTVALALIAGTALVSPVPASAAPTSSETLSGVALADAALSSETLSGVALSGVALADVALSGPTVASVALPPGPGRLAEALLTANDLPRGYAPSSSGYLSSVSSLGADTNICDHKISSQNHTATAQAVFVRGLPGPMLFETLSATGARTARAIVTGIAAAPRLCKTFNAGSPGSGMQAQLQFFPLRAPRLGDASAGMRFVVRPAATNMVIQGKLISVARGDVAVTILIINAPDRGQRELNLVAATAIRKLDRVM
jgi:hypothetical protein